MGYRHVLPTPDFLFRALHHSVHDEVLNVLHRGGVFLPVFLALLLFFGFVPFLHSHWLFVYGYKGTTFFCVLLPTNPLRVGTYGQGLFQLVLEVERLSLSECQVVVAAHGTPRAKL